MKRIKEFSLLIVIILSLAGCMAPLILASNQGDIKKVNQLLDQGADVNEDDIGFTSLIHAAREGHIDIVKLLLKRGANVNARSDDWNITALHFAVDRGHIDVVRCLLAKGADVNSVATVPSYRRKFSSLQLAEKRGNTQIIQMLKAAKSGNAYIAINSDALLIAVLDFEAKGISRQDSVRVSEWLRSELINTGQFKVIERSAMSAILKEQSFSMSGCTDTSCAVQVGKLLSAKKMLVGTVESWNNKVFIHGRIIDVEKGVAEFAHKETVYSLNELDAGSANFAKNLARRINGLPVE